MHIQTVLCSQMVLCILHIDRHDLQ